MRKYENPQYLQENRLPQRAYYVPKNEGACIELNGMWKFDFYERDYDDVPVSSAEIDVPSCWQCRGYESPNYTNHSYPFPIAPPYVPEDNPMGVYSRTFTLKDMTRKYYIVFEGVSSCLELYINGQFAGYSEGSRLQAEFDITELVHAGENEVTAKVRKWCSGSYLEDQDCFRYNGIFRDVYVLNRPVGHIEDLDVTAAVQLITTYLREWEKIAGIKDSGYFGTTPFFISFVDAPAKLRKAQHLYLTSLCHNFMGNKDEFSKRVCESASLNNENLFAMAAASGYLFTE